MKLTLQSILTPALLTFGITTVLTVAIAQKPVRASFGNKRKIGAARVPRAAGRIGRAVFPALILVSPAFPTAVAAGDVTDTDAVLWGRYASGAVANLNLQVSTDSLFSVYTTWNVNTDAARDYTVKTIVSGLTPGTRYYYRFVDTSNGNTTNTGTFKTAPAANTSAPVHFAFSGDADGQWRPYPVMNNFGQTNLDFFVFLGDTIYETASGGSGADASAATSSTTTSSATPAALRSQYQKKYRENLLPVSTGAFSGLRDFFASQGNYTLLDNHELGNKQYINGGAPAGGAVAGQPTGAGVDASNITFDINLSTNTGDYMNKSNGFVSLVNAFLDYQPVREVNTTVSSTIDPRTAGTVKQYKAQQWGRNLIFVNVDDRSYRDIRLKDAAGNDDTGSTRADNPQRTMLGKTQLAWLKQTLLDAQSSGIIWKIIAISSPIDQTAKIGSSYSTTQGFGISDGGKSWIGGYRAERQDLLSFIATNKITNVVFLSTDDHQDRINELTYQVNSSAQAVVPGNVFEVVAGPIGAGGPDTITDHTFANIKSITDQLVAREKADGVDPFGLDRNYPGLHNVARDGDPGADALRQPVDFYSPDTFNFATLDLSDDGRTLTVSIKGIDSYLKNTFPQPATTGQPRTILSFQVDAYPLVSRGGYVYNRTAKAYDQTITVVNNSPNAIAGPINLVVDNLSAGAALANPAGATTNYAPLGAPYVTVLPAGKVLPAGSSASALLRFTNTGAAITYTTRVILAPAP